MSVLNTMLPITGATHTYMRRHVQVVGEGRCPIVDTWWQTETGSAMITPLPGAWPTKPGCATLPFFGVDLVLVSDDQCAVLQHAELPE